ncbi:MAG TPA: hypothetical protein VKB93_02420 [Thermoanaerobaculia bacterium]|nr:hypothetical protein [Thermoanaerobaculia bacterium]
MLAAATRRGAAVDVRITNRSASDIVLISPNIPNRQVDEERCTQLLSTKVQEWIQPYAFTPELVELKAGEAQTFAVEVQKGTLAECRDWRVDIEYAYVPSKEARAAQQQGTANFREYVLRHQQIAHK